MMKTVLALTAAAALTVSLAAFATGASAQAAASLPNTFDRAPGQQAATAVPAQAQAQAQGAPDELPSSSPEVVQRAEAMLRKTVKALVDGQPNYDDMSEDLARQVREQAPNIRTLLTGFGAPQSLGYVGHDDGAELFVIDFERQSTQWIYAENEQGKIVALMFRPAPAAGAAAAQ